MAKIKIVTDSSAQLTPEEIEEYDIHVIPLSVEINGENHVDGETITGTRRRTAQGQHSKDQSTANGTFFGNI